MNTTWLIISIILIVIGIGLGIWAFIEFEQHNRGTQPVSLTSTRLPASFFVIAGLALLLLIAGIIMMVFAFRSSPKVAMNMSSQMMSQSPRMMSQSPMMMSQSPRMMSQSPMMM